MKELKMIALMSDPKLRDAMLRLHYSLSQSSALPKVTAENLPAVLMGVLLAKSMDEFAQNLGHGPVNMLDNALLNSMFTSMSWSANGADCSDLAPGTPAAQIAEGMFEKLASLATLAVTSKEAADALLSSAPKPTVSPKTFSLDDLLNEIGQAIEGLEGANLPGQPNQDQNPGGFSWN